MRLTRRDAVAALAAAGVAIGGGLAAHEHLGRGDDDRTLGDGDVSTLVALAEVLYPEQVESVDSFVEAYVRGVVDAEPDRAVSIGDSVAYLDDYAAAWYDEPFAELDPETREDALRRMDVDSTEPVPAGSDVERVRYHLVDELLFALYTTPTGGQLVGIENPPGYPGGRTSYRRGPEP